MPERLIQIGDVMQGFKATEDRQLIPKDQTIIAIYHMPETEEERTELIDGIIREYHDNLRRYGVTVISGKTLADKPQYADRVDMNALYVVEI